METDIPIGFNGNATDILEKRYQYELKENEHAHLDFSVAEVEQLIKDNKE
ncbi:hypothetical protein BHOIPH791_12320 [Bartonella henselae]|nr:hypothetical protein [Bartonella henselae]MDM9984004.1 hypothetical protein [Bartonella henselae]MDM9985368.1 hypothetical protein [Bartonella henselae]MDM9986860.1 hypothetical protein [Bartonella henselae]MDM9988294.1 hypothetical protein [Bartonella henselae]MDM9989711.1 hypothetical protein [Bartonella henselae]